MGGTTGIGLSAARAFIQEGASVVIVGRNASSAEKAIEELGEHSRVLIGDATDSATATQAIDMALKQFGAFHGLYHVAGGSGRKFGDGPMHELTDEGWDQTLQLNLTTQFYSNRHSTEFIGIGMAHHLAKSRNDKTQRYRSQGKPYRLSACLFRYLPFPKAHGWKSRFPI